MKYLAYLSVLMLVGCTASYQQSSVNESNAKLLIDNPVFISTPDDGWYSDKEYRNSGRMTATETRAAFVKHSSDVAIINNCAAEECFEQITAKSGYLVVPVILHWEDRATEWSGKRDRIEIQLRIYDVATREELASTVFSGKSKWMTFGGDHPQDLLPKPLNKYVGSLY
jgi:hypothetical protein